MPKPNAASLMDYFVPWTIYLIAMQLLGICILIIRFLPFYFQIRKIDQENN